MVDYLLMILKSNRVKAAVFAFVLAMFSKYLPDYAPDQDTLNWLYGIIVALIAGDTLRPVDSKKKNAL